MASSANYGVCRTCKKRLPIQHVVRDGKVYVAKDCPACGPSEMVVSADAATWQHKRDIWGYDAGKPIACSLHCESCGRTHSPRMVFLDVTNRCNMNCPICIANIPGMGFEFHPPLEYFEKVCAGLAKMEFPPTVQLFGGEPTVREDLFEIIDICRKHGLRVRIVTNGLRLADEDYCKRLCDAKVPVLIAFDGPDPEIYRRMRRSGNALEKKLQAFENLKKHSRRKNTIMCCVARNINDKHMPSMLDFCHENQDYIARMHLIPLTETWDEGEFDTDVTTTIEDVERIMDEAIPDERVEFVSAGLAGHLKAAMPFYGSPRLTFGGAHPNCESMTVLFSDGERWHGLSHYTKRPMDEVSAELIAIGKRLDGKLAGLDPKRWFQRWRGRLAVGWALFGPWRRTFNLKRVFKGSPTLSILRILWGMAWGRKAKDLLRERTRVRGVLHMIVLPFEEYHSIEGARLENCPSGFAFEDPDTGEIKTIPVCAWSLYKTEIQRKLAEKYSPKPVAVEAGAGVPVASS